MYTYMHIIHTYIHVMQFQDTTDFREIQGSHTGVTEDSDLLECDATSS